MAKTKVKIFPFKYSYGNESKHNLVGWVTSTPDMVEIIRDDYSLHVFSIQIHSGRKIFSIYTQAGGRSTFHSEKLEKTGHNFSLLVVDTIRRLPGMSDKSYCNLYEVVKKTPFFHNNDLAGK